MSVEVFLKECGLNDLIISEPGNNEIRVSDLIQIFFDLAEILPAVRTEKQAIMKALEENGFRIDRSSAALGCSPNTLYRKRKKYGLL